MACKKSPAAREACQNFKGGRCNPPRGYSKFSCFIAKCASFNISFDIIETDTKIKGKNAEKNQFCEIGPKIAVDDVGMRTIVQI